MATGPKTYTATGTVRAQALGNTGRVAGMYSRGATILFGTSRGATTIRGLASDRANLVCPCVLSDLCDDSFVPGPVCC